MWNLVKWAMTNPYSNRGVGFRKLYIICMYFYLMQSFEALNQRAVAVVVDPIQSVKGKVVIDAFRLINPQTMMLGQEPRQTTSNLGHLNKPSIQVSVLIFHSKAWLLLCFLWLLSVTYVVFVTSILGSDPWLE